MPADSLHRYVRGRVGRGPVSNANGKSSLDPLRHRRAALRTHAAGVAAKVVAAGGAAVTPRTWGEETFQDPRGRIPLCLPPTPHPPSPPPSAAPSRFWP